MEPPKKPNLPKSNFHFSTQQKSEKPMTNFAPVLAKSTNIVGAEKVKEKTAPQKSKKIAIIALLAVLVAIIIGVSTTMIIVFPNKSRMNDISINFITKSSFEPIIISGGSQDEDRQLIMPGDTVKCTFSLESQKDENFDDDGVNLDVFLRFRVYFEAGENFFSTLHLNLVSDDTWIKGVDGYYYYSKGVNSDGVLSPGDRLEISRSFYIDEKLGNEYAGKQVNVYFDAEVLQANYQAAVELWPSAPPMWMNQFRDLV